MAEHLSIFHGPALESDKHVPFSLLGNHLAYGHETEGGDGTVIIVDWKMADGIKDTGRIPRWHIPHCKAWVRDLFPVILYCTAEE